MRWRRGTDTPDVIDARGGGGRLGGLPMGRMGGGLGLTGLLIYLAIQLLGGGGGGFAVNDPFGSRVAAPESRPIPRDQDPERDLRDFSAYVFTRAQESWQRVFDRQGRSYDRAQMVLYRDAVSTGCGNASSAVGPFYCPADNRVYLDLSFYGDMQKQLQASGDFAWAYVIAHEVGHHVQNELGTSDRVRNLSAENRAEANELSVRLELQADCYAGVWAQTVYESGDLEEGDLDEAFGAAEAVGDDRLQRRAGGGVNPDSFTHGTSAQRKRWFKRGQLQGEPAACDTFGPDDV
jgi:uncharacterized protein